MRSVIFLISIFSVLSVRAMEPGASERFLKGLAGLTDLQTPFSCTKVQKFSGQCSDTLAKMVKDDSDDRLLVFTSMASDCRSRINTIRATKTKNILDFSRPELLQKAYETNMMGYLGQYTNEAAKSCLLLSSTRNNDAISKFYYLTVRLNETSGKIAQEQVIIDRYLNSKAKTPCPNIYLLNAANQVCEVAKACPSQETLDQLAVRVQKEEDLYIQATAVFQKLSKDCEKDENCLKQKGALSAVIAGLLAKNPWFVNHDFTSQRLKYSTKSRLEKYLKLAQENLVTQQARLQKASMCLHTSGHDDCKIDEIRETLSLTQDIPEFGGGVSASERILNDYNNYQKCLEDGSLARNRASGVVEDTIKNAGLGLVALPIGARWAAAKGGKMVLAEMGALFAADVAVNVLSSRDSWKQMEEKCFSAEHMDFQFKKASAQNVCENSSSALSPSTHEKSACLVNAGLSALSALPFVGLGYNVVRYAQASGIFKAAAPLKEAASALTETSAVRSGSSEAKTGGLERGKDRRRPADDVAIERRQGGTPRADLQTVWVSEKNVNLAVAPNLPSRIRIVEVEKVDGSKTLVYKYPEKLKDGTWVAGVHEFQLDEVSGGINANYPAGRELLTSIIQEKAGKAYFAFIDVGSLGFVNKQFKAGEVAGDRYLKGVADKIKEIGGGKITLARTGGDEFCLVIDEVDPSKAKALLEKIQAAIRKDSDGLAKRVFFEEQMATIIDAKEALKKLEALPQSAAVVEQKAQVLKQIDDLSRVQQPDISIGIAQIGSADSFADLAARTEDQASKMKISTALQFGRSAEKYGSKEIPNAKPNPTYVAPVQDPVPSSSWKTAKASAGKSPTIDSLRVMVNTPQEEVLRFSNMAVYRFEDELLRTSYKTERFIVDAAGKRVQVISDIPTRGSSALLDGTHPEGQRLITSFVESQSDTYFGLLKLRSLKYLNYLPSGTKVGDEILAVLGELIKKNTRSKDLNLSLGGADSLMGIKNRTPENMNSFFEKLTEQLKASPKVVEVFARETAILTEQISKAKTLGNTQLVAELQKRIEDLKHFNLDLQFQILPRGEMSPHPTLKEIQKKFDAKFNQANKGT